MFLPTWLIWGNSSISTRNLAILIPKSLVCTRSPCPACCPSVLTWHCIDSLNCFLLCTPCSTCGRRQRYLASPLPLVHASHCQWHCVSLSTTGCQSVCSCKILSNIIYFNSLQIGLGTAKTLPPNTSLILQAMAIFTPDWNSAAPSRFWHGGQN